MRKLRVGVRRTTQSPEGTHVIRYGVCFGYWPCLRAPFIQLSFGTRTIEVWHGLPSYQSKGGVKWQSQS